jgi:RNA polymerase sigma-70 factor (ECF subfamily)
MTEVMDAPVTGAGGVDAGAASAEAWEWVRAAQAGDREAFGRLYARYQPGVLRFVRWRVGDPGLAEDLTSEAFVRALRRLETLRERRADPGAWLTTIARNLVADHRKSPRSRFDEVVAEVPESRDELDRPGVEAVAGARADREVAARLVADCLERLTPAQRRTIELYQEAPEFGAGPAVAEAMGRSHGAVKTLKSTALSRMREHLADQGLFSSDDCYHTGLARPRQRHDHTGRDDGADEGAGDGPDDDAATGGTGEETGAVGSGRFEAHLAHSRRVLAEMAAGRHDQTGSDAGRVIAGSAGSTAGGEVRDERVAE